jgi:quinoprotein glucose dehydrogenase
VVKARYSSIGAARGAHYGALLVTLALCAAPICDAIAQSDIAANDWPAYSRDLAGTRFSPLREITARNVRRLRQAWSVPLAEDTGNNGQVTPIVIDGVMYLPAGGNKVLALDAATGTSIWRYELPPNMTTEVRGVAYWSGDGTRGPRILLTAGPRMLALDAKTGQPAREFGGDGFIEIAVPWNGVPTIYQHVAILGATTGEIALGAPGDTRAFDVRTGANVWNFHTVPLPGEPGHETWLDHGWRNRSGVNVWAWYMTLDAERGILYMPVASAAGNYWGGDRPGTNLFSNSIVAVDALTGRYLWHFQTVHHDLWDADMPNPPALVDIERDGEKIPALASVGKTGYMFILNRVTGEPIFGVEERPVPQGTVPGEWYSPTQPFPVKPARALSRVDFDKARDMVRPEDTSAQHVAACEALWERSGGFHYEGPFTPFSFHAAGDPPRSTLQLPGGTGGVNWGGAAVDPTTGYVYVNAHDTSLVGWIEQKRPGGNYGRGVEGSTIPFDRASVGGPGPYAGFNAQLKDEDGNVLATLPCYRPPWARLAAVDANTGEIVWESVLGLSEELPEGKQLTGRSGSAGPTVTAGGVVLIGATEDHRLRAFDARSGRELWAVELENTVNANPMTYRGKDGKQYVVAVATDTLVAFSLP